MLNKYKLPIAGFLVFTLLVVITFLIWYFSFLNSKVGKDFTLQVNKGETKVEVLNNISTKLDYNSQQKFFLKLYIYLNKNTLQFDAGNYSFKGSTTNKGLINGIRGGSSQISVTFLEGWRVEENANELSKIINSNYASEYYERALPLIGYLFPDTYFVDLNLSPNKLIETQLTEFREKTDDLFTNYSGSLSQEELVIIASIVEREVRSIPDKKVVAGILIKRYLEGMPLDADATSQYGLYYDENHDFFDLCVIKTSPNCESAKPNSFEYWPKVTSLDDLKLGEEYNTRGVLGLPPTPISNPSLSSIEATINSTPTEYYYYLNDTAGNTYFAVTLEEHIANINKYL